MTNPRLLVAAILFALACDNAPPPAEQAEQPQTEEQLQSIESATPDEAQLEEDLDDPLSIESTSSICRGCRTRASRCCQNCRRQHTSCFCYGDCLSEYYQCAGDLNCGRAPRNCACQ